MISITPYEHQILTSHRALEKSIDQLFEEQAKNNPTNIAVICGNKTINYQNLSKLSNQLAHYLLENNNKKNGVTALFFNRSVEMLIAMLATLKAGWAYTPICYDWPEDKIKNILKDVKPDFILTTSLYEEQLKKNTSCQKGCALLAIEKTLEKTKDLTTTLPKINHKAQKLAYIIYTSGTTGQPKGVAIRNISLTNVLLSTKRVLNLENEINTLSLTSYTFDISGLEFYLPLITGGKCFLEEKDIVYNSKNLENLFKNHDEINLLQGTCSLWKVILESKVKINKKIKIIVGGEKLQNSLAKSLLEISPNVWNMYGPTETTIWSTYYRLSDDDIVQGKPIPIGKAIDNTNTYIFDENMKPTLAGGRGELYIGGTGVAQNYYNQPNLTKERFIQNPLQPDEIIYKTGDIVSLLPDGNLVFYGRIDNQVKIHGYRVELEEIECILLQLPYIKQCAVIAKEVEEQTYLIAYLSISIKKTQIDIHKIKDFLKSKIQEHMIPTTFVVLDQLPLTNNLKIDRNKLQTKDEISFIQRKQSSTRKTTTQRELIKIYADIFNIKEESIGNQCDFFELGGNSLIAARILTHIRDQLNIELSYHELFSLPNLEELAHYIDKKEPGSYKPRLTPKNNKNESTFPLSCSQKRLWFLYKAYPQDPFYNTVMMIEFSGKLDFLTLECSIKNLISRHAILRTIFIERNGKPYQQVKRDNYLAEILEIKDLKDSSPQQVDKLIHQLSHTPLTLSEPSLKAVLFQLEEGRNLLHILMHHIIIDGWSSELFITELLAEYNNVIQQHETSSTKEINQYHHFVNWQNHHLQSSIYQQQFAYWQKQLHKLPQAAAIPADYPRNTTSQHQGGHVCFLIDDQLMSKIKVFIQKENLTLFTVLLTALDLLLLQYGNGEDIVLATPMTNRQHAQFEKTFGLLTNMVILRSNLEGNPTYGALLQRNRGIILDALQNQDVPFEELVNYFNPTRTYEKNPLFQISINLEPDLEKTFELNQLTAKAKPYHLDCSIFDLSFFFYESQHTVKGYLQFNSGLYHRNTAERLVKQLHYLIGDIISMPDKAINEIHLISHKEQLAILHTPDIAHGDFTSVVEQFDNNMPRHLQNIALNYNNREMSYDELNKQANQLAHYLKGKSVEKGDIIGIYLTQDITTIIVILAILKVGAAYLPISTQWPPSLINLVLQESQPAFLIIESQLFETTRELTFKRYILIDKIVEQLKQRSTNNPKINISPNDIAYIIYTSGTTGKPKGVMVSHYNLFSLFISTKRLFDFDHRDVWTLSHSIAFDFSVWEIWGALLNGAKLVIVPYCITRTLDSFYQLIAKTKVTVLNTTPSAFYQFINLDSMEKASLSLRYVIFGGEKLELNQLTAWVKNHRPLPKLVNMYGITEVTVHATYYEITPDDIEKHLYSPIGKMLPNSSAYVLDKSMNVVLPGIIGELYIAGNNVTQGYLHQPELSEKYFSNSPFQGDDNIRLYKTGDLVRYLPDGTLEYIGRKDNQIKIRGYRIELDDIKYHLESCPQVKQAIVTTQQRGAEENNSLLAYVLLKDDYKIPEATINLENKYIQQWQTVFQTTYSGPANTDRFDLNIAGWINSYNRQAYSASEMEEWVNHIVDQVLSFRPRRVLEVGCGTGLLLFRLAAHAQFYHAIDISQAALDYISKQLENTTFKNQVHLERKFAHEIQPISNKKYDTVILSSIVQYFPSIAYFVQILKKAIVATCPGGHIIIADLRNFDLLEMFHATAQLYQASSDTSYQQWKSKVEQAINEEEELLISPDFFENFTKTYPRVIACEINLKHGSHCNEITQFRYDVILTMDKVKQESSNQKFMDWQSDKLSLDLITETLKKNDISALSVSNVPNARLAPTLNIIKHCHKEQRLFPIKHLFEKKENVLNSGDINPDAITKLAQENGCHANISWSKTKDPAVFDVLFQKQIIMMTNNKKNIYQDNNSTTDYVKYANQPIKNIHIKNILTKIKNILREKLPEYMIPFISIINRVPLTDNGKIDYKALPLKSSASQYLVRPRNKLEEQLHSVWSTVLNTSHFSIRDNFFEIGGHSLLAVELVTLINKRLSKNLSIQTLFTYPTIEQLAQYLNT